jgi:15-hydroxyprostaglandin dehydrogenase (NAD)
MAVMAGTYLAMDRMSLKSGGSGGLIINTASLAGLIFGDGGKEMAEGDSYFVAKHGVVALTRALGVKGVFAETGVQLRCICPSFADTNLIKEGVENVEEIREKIKKDFGLMK